MLTLPDSHWCHQHLSFWHTKSTHNWKVTLAFCITILHITDLVGILLLNHLHGRRWILRWLWFFVCLFALFPNEAARITQTYIVTSGILQSNMPKHLHAECLQILSLGLTMCQSLFSCGHLILHQNCCWPFLVFMMSVWIFITVWAPDTKQTASIACFYSCKVWTRESQTFYQACHFSFLDTSLMDVDDSALKSYSAFQRRYIFTDQH